MIHACPGAHLRANTCTCTFTLAQDLAEEALTKEQEELVGKGCAGPPVTLDSKPLTEAQVQTYCKVFLSCSHEEHTDIPGHLDRYPPSRRAVYSLFWAVPVPNGATLLINAACACP